VIEGPRDLVAAARDTAVTAAALERRLRFMRVAGWITGDIDTCRPGEDPALPPIATVYDHLAIVFTARTVITDDAELASLADALRNRPAAAPIPASVLAPEWSRLEAVSAMGDSAFGRRRVLPVWPALRNGVRIAGDLKRRFLG
jgi:hypothetical protein